MADADAMRAELAAIEGQIAALIRDGDKLRARLPEYAAKTAPGYRGTHFGSGGDAKGGQGLAGDPRSKLTLMGMMTECAYRATKLGYPRDAVFRHSFSEPLPALTYTREAKLVIVGGAYRITMRGIEG